MATVLSYSQHTYDEMATVLSYSQHTYDKMATVLSYSQHTYDEMATVPDHERHAKIKGDTLRALIREYEYNPYPRKTYFTELSGKLQISPRKIQVWFQNRRQKEKAISPAIILSTENDFYLLPPPLDPKPSSEGTVDLLPPPLDPKPSSEGTVDLLPPPQQSPPPTKMRSRLDRRPRVQPYFSGSSGRPSPVAPNSPIVQFPVAPNSPIVQFPVAPNSPIVQFPVAPNSPVAPQSATVSYVPSHRALIEENVARCQCSEEIACYSQSFIHPQDQLAPHAYNVHRCPLLN